MTLLMLLALQRREALLLHRIRVLVLELDLALRKEAAQHLASFIKREVRPHQFFCLFMRIAHFLV